MLRKMMVLGAISSIVGCSSPGPMQSLFGPIDTPVFEAIALDSVGESSSEILFKSTNAILYRNGELDYFTASVFFVTEKGAYASSWDLNSYQYNLLAKVPIESIDDVYYKTVERDFAPDVDLLVIRKKSKEEVGFTINGSSAAKTILEELISK